MTDLVATLREQGQREAADEIQRLRQRVLELETELFFWRGGAANPDPDQPATFDYDVPSTTPKE